MDGIDLNILSKPIHSNGKIYIYECIYNFFVEQPGQILHFIKNAFHMLSTEWNFLQNWSIMEMRLL